MEKSTTWAVENPPDAGCIWGVIVVCFKRTLEETMSQSVNCTSDTNVTQGKNADPATINSLIAELADQDGTARQRARLALVEIGKSAMAPLMEALTDPNDDVRWEAAKALGQIGDPKVAPALVSALEDENSGVRWLAAEGLIALGREGLAPLLQALEKRPDSGWLRQGAHHVLHDLAGKGLSDLVSPMLTALEDVEPTVEVPWAAKAALDALKETAHQRGDQ
jgi:HEAT repeat protein